MHQSVAHLVWYETCLIRPFKALVIPAAYHSTQAKTGGHGGDSALMFNINQQLPDLDPDAEKGLLVISRGTAILLLGVYIAYLFFQVSPAKIIDPRD